MVQLVTVELSDPVYQHLMELAAQTQLPLEDLVRQSVEGNLPPLLTAAGEGRAQLLAMQTLSVNELKAVASQQIPPDAQARHEALLERNSAGLLTAAEKEELDGLRQAQDRRMLRKAYAWAHLRWRGVPVPSRHELPLK